MKKQLSFLSVFCLTLIIFSACASKGKEAQSLKETLDKLPVELDADTSELLDKIDDIDITAPPASEPKIRISVVLPEGWSEEENDTSIVSYNKDTNFIEVFEVWKPDDVNDLKGFAESEKKTLEETFKDAVFYEIENIKLSGMDAFCMPIDISFAGVKQRQTYIYFEKGGAYYKIMLACFPDDEAGMKDMESILESMKIE
jgi:hypothetical protein